MGLVEEHVNLTNKIVSGQYDRNQVQSEIERIEKVYGQSSFPPCDFLKKSSPWTMSDLDRLRTLSGSGACSKDFYLYMAEVSEYVHKEKESKSVEKSGNRQPFAAKYWVVIIAVIVIVCLLIWFANGSFSGGQK